VSISDTDPRYLNSTEKEFSNKGGEGGIKIEVRINFSRRWWEDKV
jgi:hypothetical protein